MKTYSYLRVETGVWDDKGSWWDETLRKRGIHIEGGDTDDEEAANGGKTDIEMLNRLGARGWKLAFQDVKAYEDGTHNATYTLIKELDG